MHYNYETKIQIALHHQNRDEIHIQLLLKLGSQVVWNLPKVPLSDGGVRRTALQRLMRQMHVEESRKEESNRLDGPRRLLTVWYGEKNETVLPQVVIFASMMRGPWSASTISRDFLPAAEPTGLREHLKILVVHLRNEGPYSSSL